jgi:hypothetical protein
MASASAAQTLIGSATAYIQSILGQWIDAGSAEATSDVVRIDVSWEPATAIMLAEPLGPLLP